MNKKLIISMLLLFVFSPLALAQYTVETLELTIYEDGYVKVTQVIVPDEYTVVVDVPLMGGNVKGLMVRDENNNPLLYKLNNSILSIYFENVTSIIVTYYTPDLTSKDGPLWSINLTSEVPVTIDFPENTVIVGLNSVPLKIDKNKLVMPPGNISISYVIERNPSSTTSGSEVEGISPTSPPQGVQQETKWLLYVLPILAILIAGGYLFLKKQPSESPTSGSSLPLSREEFQKKIEGMDLSRDEMRVLLYLYDRGGKAPQAEVKDVLRIPKTTAWRMFKRLEEKGLVKIYKKKRENWVELLF
ncbi:helix-turn-helix transcriptional regulator [Thermococcus litoralis]|uniref:helix-turn-helix transcriptional regulator n=1 Tax=Thermococcus litoralis TaxID=2265 RepID=UPI000B34CA4C|nr:MarR family transcriptional regulator [Thermococcus litoralis]